MNRSSKIVVLAAALAMGSAQAQFVKGNEAVTHRPDGSKRVETPPFPSKRSAAKTNPCAADGGCHAGPWYMVETDAGLQECTEPWARPTSCRASSYGATKRSRLWILKTGKTWLWCQLPDLSSKCVDMYARPPLNLSFDAVQ